MGTQYRSGGCFQVQSSEILDGWTLCYREKAQNPAVFSLKAIFHVFEVRTTECAQWLYGETFLFINFAH